MTETEKQIWVAAYGGRMGFSEAPSAAYWAAAAIWWLRGNRVRQAMPDEFVQGLLAEMREDVKPNEGHPKEVWVIEAYEYEDSLVVDVASTEEKAREMLRRRAGDRVEWDEDGLGFHTDEGGTHAKCYLLDRSLGR